MWHGRPAHAQAAYSGECMAETAMPRFKSQRPALHLLAFNRFKERREVAFAEAVAVAAALDNFVEQRRPVEDRLAEELQQVPVRPVTVHEDAQLLELLGV